MGGGPKLSLSGSMRSMNASIRLVRSKLRKRAGDSESHHSTTTAPPVLAPMALLSSSTTSTASAVLAPVALVHQASNASLSSEPPLSSLYQPPSLWHYPAAHFLYATDQEVTVTPLPTERPGFCRGVRKNLGGRWKRLVKRKSTSDGSAVSRDHLKQIYVY